MRSLRRIGGCRRRLSEGKRSRITRFGYGAQRGKRSRFAATPGPSRGGEAFAVFEKRVGETFAILVSRGEVGCGCSAYRSCFQKGKRSRNSVDRLQLNRGERLRNCFLRRRHSGELFAVFAKGQGKRSRKKGKRSRIEPLRRGIVRRIGQAGRRRGDSFANYELLKFQKSHFHRSYRVFSLPKNFSYPF